jgi:glycosyltransferase involved in cell wall biosynthesis
MKSILFIRKTSENMGGIENQIYKLANNIYERNIFKPVLITSATNTPLALLFKENGFDVYAVAFDNPIKGACQISKIIEKNNVALIQSHMFRESIQGRLVKLFNPKIPHIFRVHTHIDCSWISSFKKNLYHLLDKSTSFLVDGYICINEFAKNELMNRTKINEEKIYLVSDAVDEIGKCDSDEFSYRNYYKLAMISNLTPHKGHDVLIKGIRLLKDKGMDVKVRLIGGENTNIPNRTDDTFTKHLIKLSEENGVRGQIEFYGYTKDIYAALDGYPVVVLPSDSEGTPNSLLEAMSVKKLVIASEVGGIPEFIEDGISGYLHKPQSSEDFARKVELAFKKPPEELEQIAYNGYMIWSKKFKTEVIIDQLLECYVKLGIIEQNCFA